MSENKQENVETVNFAETRYPILLYQNTSINAKPPYKVLRFSNGDYIQLIDMRCAQFHDDLIKGGSYSIALFSLKEGETELIRQAPDKLDRLANLMYEHIPADRFVRASVVKANQPYDIQLAPKCESIDEMLNPDEKPTKVELAKPTDAESQSAEAQEIGRFDLHIVPDVLSDEQREKYVFAPIRAAHRIEKAELDGLSLTELMSVAFVTSKCNVDRKPQFYKDAKEANFKLLLNLVAEYLLRDAFFAIFDRMEQGSVKLYNNGVPFTPIFSSREAAESVISENERMECVEIAENKADFFRKNLDRGIVQFIVDGNPVTLSVQGFCNFMTDAQA